MGHDDSNTTVSPPPSCTVTPNITQDTGTVHVADDNDAVVALHSTPAPWTLVDDDNNVVVTMVSPHLL